MNEDFITYELAKKLKEKGFDWQTFDWYDMAGNFCKGFMPRELMCREYYAPTISQILKWLRKEKKIYVSILPFATHSTINKVAFYYLIEYNSTGETMEGIEQSTYCAEWNDAAFTGISYVLDNLI